MENEKNTFFEDYQAMMLAVEALRKDSTNPFFNSKYVNLNNVLTEVKKVCKSHNFIFIQKPKVITYLPENKQVNLLNTIIQHKSGEKIEGEIEIVSKDHNDPQKVGAGLTYMRRYSLTTMFGIQEEDDDGNKSSQPAKKPETKKASSLQVNAIKEILKIKGKTEEKILETLKVSKLEDISEKQAEGIINKLNQ